MSCPSSTQLTYTLSELQNATFANSLFAQMPANTTRANGLLSSDSANQWIQALIDTNKLPTIPSPELFDNAAKNASQGQTENTVIKNYVTKETEFSVGLKSEYCFYEARYKYALRTLLSKMSSQYDANVPTDITSQIQTYLNVSESLNQKLNDLLVLSNIVAKNRRDVAKQRESETNSINDELAARTQTLQMHASILRDKSATSELYKRMMEYTEEKNKANRNLLSLYSFLNIVALGMLVYIYRASSK
jgi:hypothetical protein